MNKKTVFGAAAAVVCVAVALVFLLRPKHVEEILPIVGVDTVRTRNVEVYGEFPGKIRAQGLRRPSLLIKYEKDVLQAFREVYEANVGFQSARSNSYEKSVMEEAAGKYITLANSQYINGVINYIDVLDAQRKYLSSQIEFNEAKTRENLALVGLYKALGGGWN